MTTSLEVEMTLVSKVDELAKEILLARNKEHITSQQAVDFAVLLGFLVKLHLGHKL